MARLWLAGMIGVLSPGWAGAQCSDRWLPGSPMLDLDGPVYAAVVWDPDGAGPESTVLVLGGDFGTAGTGPANYIAAWNGQTGGWEALGTGPSQGLNAPVWALAVYNGALIAAGVFTSAGAQALNHIARWNPATGSWEPLGSGLSSGGGGGVAARVLTVYNGELITGGAFLTAGGQSVNNIARWNGSSWSPLGSGVSAPSYPQVYALALYHGELIVGGSFFSPGRCLARWNGAAWVSLGSALGEVSYVNALTVYNDELVAAGFFFHEHGAPDDRLARWNGSTWGMVGGGMQNDAYVLADYGGDLIVGGQFNAIGPIGQYVLSNNVARWNTALGWRPLGPGLSNYADALTTFHGELIVGGGFLAAGGQVTRDWGRWTGNSTPWLADQPEPQYIITGDPAAFGVAPAAGYTDLSYQWRRNGIPVLDGAGGAAAGGGIVAGAMGPTLTITGTAMSDAGTFDCVVATQCGSISSAAAALLVTCWLDLDRDGSIGPSDISGAIAIWYSSLVGGTFGGDFDRNGRVEPSDVAFFVQRWFNALNGGGC